MNNNQLTKVTYTRTGAIYETFDVEQIRTEINQMYEDFRDNSIMEILSSDEELSNKYFPKVDSPKEYFPITMKRPGFFFEYEIMFDPSPFNGKTELLNIINSEIGKLQSNIVNRWQQGLVEIGFLNSPE